MKSSFRPSFQIPPLLLSIATICTVFPTMGAGLRQQNYFVPNVVQAFNALEHHPEVLAFRPSADVPLADGNLARTDTHYQGIQRVMGAGVPYLFVSRSGMADDDRGRLLTVRLGSRETTGERLKSNRLAKDASVNDTGAPLTDGVVKGLKWEWHHAGGIQILGDILALPLEGKVGSDAEIGKILFLDVSKPEAPVELPVTVELSSHKAGVLGLTRMTDGAFLLVVTWGDNETVEFYRSNGNDFTAPGFAFSLHDTWSSGELKNSSEGWPTGKTSYQGLTLVNQADGRLFMVGGRNTFSSTPFITGEDRLGLYEITGVGGGTLSTNVVLTQMGSERHLYCSTDGPATSPMRGATARLNADFLAGVGTYVSPTGELLVYACEHYNDGPARAVRFVEFRHRDVYRPGSPAYGPAAVAAESVVEIDEGSVDVLDGRLSHGVLARPWVELYDEDNFEGRSVVQHWDDRGLDDYQDLRKLDDFNDKASSMRWYAPVGWSVVIYDQDNFGVNEPYKVIPCTGAIQEIANLSDDPWKFDNGDLININETRITSFRMVPPNPNPLDIPITYAWKLGDNPNENLKLGDATLAVARVSAKDGPMNSQATLTIGPGNLDSTVVKIRVRNVPPQITRKTAEIAPSRNGQVDLLVEFTDPGVLDTHKATIDWQDGVLENVALSSGARSFRARHTYNPNGSKSEFQVAIRIVDNDKGEVVDPLVVQPFGPLVLETDSDADHLPDIWERAVFGNLNARGDADSDGDGTSNYDEFMAGTNPLDASDSPRLELRKTSPSRWTLSILGRKPEGVGLSQAKRRYQMERSNDLQTWEADPRFPEETGLGEPLNFEFGREQPAAQYQRVRIWIESR
jgi:hypothetical protein